jgi:hypothetical protein
MVFTVQLADIYRGIALREIFPLFFWVKTGDNFCNISAKRQIVCRNRTCDIIKLYDTINIAFS